MLEEGVKEISCRFFRNQIFCFSRKQLANLPFLAFKLHFSVTGLADGERRALRCPSRNEHRGSASRCPVWIHSLSVCITSMTPDSGCLLGGLFYLKTHGLSSQGTNVRMLRLCLVVTHARCEWSSSDMWPVWHLTRLSTGLAMRLSGTMLPYHLSQLF